MLPALFTIKPVPIACIASAVFLTTIVNRPASRRRSSTGASFHSKPWRGSWSCVLVSEPYRCARFVPDAVISLGIAAGDSPRALKRAAQGYRIHYSLARRPIHSNRARAIDQPVARLRSTGEFRLWSAGKAIRASELPSQADATPADSADSQRKRRAWLMASCAMGVNPKSMVSKGPEYGLPELGRRSAAGTACIRGRFPTMSEPAPILLRYELVAQSHRRSSKIPRPTATPAYLTPPSARPFRARRRLRCRGTGPSTPAYCPRAIELSRHAGTWGSRSMTRSRWRNRPKCHRRRAS